MPHEVRDPHLLTDTIRICDIEVLEFIMGVATVEDNLTTIKSLVKRLERLAGPCVTCTPGAPLHHSHPPPGPPPDPSRAHARLYPDTTPTNSSLRLGFHAQKHKVTTQLELAKAQLIEAIQPKVRGDAVDGAPDAAIMRRIYCMYAFPVQPACRYVAVVP